MSVSPKGCDTASHTQEDRDEAWEERFKSALDSILENEEGGSEVKCVSVAVIAV
jgi:hypothetical protein